jgi:hypothetical protein
MIAVFCFIFRFHCTRFSYLFQVGLRPLKKDIRLPVSWKVMPPISWNRNIEPVLHIKEPINELLKDLYPLDIQSIEKGYKYKEFKYFISRYYYLGWSGTV